MNFRYLCYQYDLGHFLGVSELERGTASRVWKLDTDRGAFLVRTLRDRGQGLKEREICKALSRSGFAAMPAILVSCTEQGGICYQVQEYLTGTMPHPDDSTAAAMAHLAKELTHAMPEGMIHGDFGPWNILRAEDGRLSVIDFGGVREGDPCFDYATMLAGLINHTAPALRESVCGVFVRELDCDRARLLEQLRLWAQQGIETWADRDETMVSRFINAREWAEEHLYEL